MIFSGDARLMRMASKSEVNELRSWKEGRIGYTSSSAGAGAAAATSTGFFLVFKSSTSRQSDWSSRINTLNDSGNPAVNDASPFTIAS